MRRRTLVDAGFIEKMGGSSVSSESLSTQLFDVRKQEVQIFVTRSIAGCTVSACFARSWPQVQCCSRFFRWPIFDS